MQKRTAMRNDPSFAPDRQYKTTKVTKEWGPHTASRVWHILSDGSDGEIEQVRDLKPHQLPLSFMKPVPGACAPVQNLFHVSQAPSWIAGTSNTIQEQLEYVKAIPRLMEPLTEKLLEARN